MDMAYRQTGALVITVSNRQYRCRSGAYRTAGKPRWEGVGDNVGLRIAADEVQEIAPSPHFAGHPSALVRKLGLHAPEPLQALLEPRCHAVSQTEIEIRCAEARLFTDDA